MVKTCHICEHARACIALAQTPAAVNVTVAGYRDHLLNEHPEMSILAALGQAETARKLAGETSAMPDNQRDEGYCFGCSRSTATNNDGRCRACGVRK